ncbi:MAG: hypothetical protein COU33_01685 [Candidatus Magasanikbacteria bacterium CG10_big_fil_rev_8_21_14_0_10_43_6]|uniref:N-end rule aminoacyl transferase C-terminal domain-containing protein n=1 Tax=Candidatus Magasanikbacteria bacterium CG10_big_fil_rev_8_21_14_0_10_43_6 TaxID=1974650 RepID=A0A2M6W1P2_9BACT|nr:MAG: hypothetical protein COU33_01685 [Candidatus Magasanikbacteria bacterium CG10_big_fil_rev_8_21_14_0_10_43_6]
MVRDTYADAITSLYNEGYVFTRQEKGSMDQTRSVRIDLSKFELSSENRRILRKNEQLEMKRHNIPFANYVWSIGKLGKDFYDEKFGKGTFSANKMKEALTDEKNSNFTTLLIYSLHSEPVGYAICYENDDIFHYSYPFYNLNSELKNIGMGMMTRAVEYAKKSGKKYLYMGAAQRPTDTYKFQFLGMEWFDGNMWNTDMNILKKIIVTV